MSVCSDIALIVYKGNRTAEQKSKHMASWQCSTTLEGNLQALPELVILLAVLQENLVSVMAILALILG